MTGGRGLGSAKICGGKRVETTVRLSSCKKGEPHDGTTTDGGGDGGQVSVIWGVEEKKKKGASLCRLGLSPLGRRGKKRALIKPKGCNQEAGQFLQVQENKKHTP